MENIKGIVSAVSAIESVEEKLTTIELELLAAEASALTSVVAIARKGITFSTIEKSGSEYDDGTNAGIETSDGLKGVRVDFEHLDEEGGFDKDFGGNLKELWLLSDGTFAEAIFHDLGNINFPDDEGGAWTGRIGWRREFAPCADPVRVGWGYDTIVNTIVKELRRRLEKLGKRAGEQERRIEKVRAFQV